MSKKQARSQAHPQAPDAAAFTPLGIGRREPAGPPDGPIDTETAGRLTPTGTKRKGRVHYEVGSRPAAAALIPTPARKGTVQKYIYTESGRLVPWEALQKAEVKAGAKAASKQLKQDAQYMTAHGLIPMPFEVAGLLALIDNCTFFDACVRQIAQDVVGQGFELLLDDEDAKPDEAEKDRLQEFMENPNADDDAIEDIIERAIIDHQSIGWFCLEVSRDAQGTIDGLFHVPAQHVRVHKSGKKYCQLRGPDRVWFKKFGEEGEIMAGSGDPASAGTQKDKIANEMIFHRRYYQQSSWYGAPPILPAIGAAHALISIRDYNLAFFENYGVPAALVTLDGEWEDDAVPMVTNFIDAEIKGSQNQHKTIVLNPPEGGSVKWEPLIVEVKEGHFKLYSVSLRDEILVCYKMPPYRIGIAQEGSLGGNTAGESTKIYIGSTVNPLKLKTGRIITRRIIREGLQPDEKAATEQAFGFWWNDIDLRDLDLIADRCVKLFGVGAITRNGICDAMGMDALPDDEDGDRYYLSNSYVPIEEAGLDAAGGIRPPADVAGAAAEEIKSLVAKFKQAITAGSLRIPSGQADE